MHTFVSFISLCICTSIFIQFVSWQLLHLVDILQGQFNILNKDRPSRPDCPLPKSGFLIKHLSSFYHPLKPMTSSLLGSFFILLEHMVELGFARQTSHLVGIAFCLSDKHLSLLDVWRIPCLLRGQWW